ncbi:ankyrin repeat-containing domain protein [Amanita rubescens]|nr:ankyrin repeat-containing domain protein [Amanita rubescens]
MSSRIKRALSANSQASAETLTNKKAKRNDMQPQSVTEECQDMDVDSNYAAQEHRQSSNVNDGSIQILQHAQGVILDKCTIIAANQDVIFNTNHETGMSIDKYKQWLMPPDPSTNFNNALKTHLDNTGSWLLNSPDYLAWKKRDNSFLWIHGISGSGKTVLCSTLIQAIQGQTDGKSSNLAYFFCDVSDMNKRTARGLLCSLVLTLFPPQNQSVLKQVFEKCKDGLQKPTDHDLYEVLKSYLSGFQDVYLFIDALDECANVEEVLELVKIINGWSIRSCHLLVTSRKELPIVNSLRQAMPTEVDLTFMQVNQDIEQYIEHMLSNATELKTWKDNCKELIKVTLMEKGKGMFRWVACQLEELKHCSKSPRMLRQKLNGLPTTLESTYDQILTRIEEADAMNAMKLLLWLTFSERPIHVEDLALILEFDVESQQFDVDAKLDYPDDVLKICSSLVTKMKDETVQFAHASIKEYFESNKRKIGSSVKVDPCFGHYFIGQCGLAYILQRKQVIPKHDDSKDALERFEKSLLQYAVQFWPKHILACKQESAVMNQIINLFESIKSLKYWVKAYNYPFWYKSWDSNHVRMIYPNYLQIAALHGLIETVKWLMLQPVNSVACMEALSAAGCNGHINITTLLIEKGNIKVASKFYYQALQAASEAGQNQVVRLLCEHGKDNDVLHKFINMAIRRAPRSKKKETITQLINCSGLNLKIDSSTVRNVAHDGDIESVQLLLQKESDEKKRKELIVEALGDSEAASVGYKAIVDFLLRSEVGLSEPCASLRGLMHDGESYMMHWQGSLAKVLDRAAANNCKDIVEILMESGVDMKAKADALVSASARGNVHIVKLLLDSEASGSLRGLMHDEESYMMNWKGCDLAKALKSAATNGHKAIVEMLLEMQPLNGCKAIVEMLLESGADMKAKADAVVSASKHSQVHIVQLLLNRVRNERQLRFLLEQGADPNTSRRIWTSIPCILHHSMGYKHISQLLIDYGADVNSQGGEYGYAIWAAMSYGHNEIVELLLNMEQVQVFTGVPGVDVYDKGLISALSRGHKDIVKLLLEKGACVNKYGMEDSDDIPLHVASMSNYASADIVRLLLEWGADVNIVGAVGNSDTALQAASYSGKTDIVQLLLAWGANVNIQGDCYGSALMAASQKGHKRIVELLLQWGADVNLYGHYFNDDWGEQSHGSAFTIASNCGHKAIVEILLLNGADVNFCDEIDGHTALIHAAFNNTKDIVKMLLQNGADVNIQGKQYGSALYAAADGEMSIDNPDVEEIVQLLLAHGAKYLGPIDDTFTRFD